MGAALCLRQLEARQPALTSIAWHWSNSREHTERGVAPSLHMWRQGRSLLRRLYSSERRASNGFAGIPGLTQPSDWHGLANDAVSKCVLWGAWQPASGPTRSGLGVG